MGWRGRRRITSAPIYPLPPATTARTRVTSAPLALGVLELLPRPGLSVLLALPHARIARQQAGLLESEPQGVVVSDERAGYAVAHRSGLSGWSTAAHADGDIELLLGARHLEGLRDDHAQRLPGEVVLGCAAIDGDATRSGLDPHARHRRLAPARAVCAIDNRHHRISRGWGCCA